MPQIRASRLDQRQHRRSKGWFTRVLPPDTVQRKIVLWGVVPVVILLFLYWLTNNVIMMEVTHHGSEFPLPNFTGQRMIEAQLELDDLNLEYEVASHEYSPGHEKSIILKQFPPAGTKVKPGRKIKFVLSLGQKLIPIPNLSGKSVRQAMLDLETAGLVLGEIAWAFSDTLPERVVVFSYPAAGMEIPLGTPVNLMVNRGRASNFTYMPKVTGLTIDVAKKRIEDKSLKVGIVTFRTNENYLPETVLEQSEPEGTELDVGTEIDLVVSSTE